MGSTQSAQVLSEDEQEEEGEDEEEDGKDDQEGDQRNHIINNGQIRRLGGGDGGSGGAFVKKVLEQEPEMLPCHASASPLSLSSLGTPRLGPSIKVWDPYNVLAPPPPPPPPQFPRSFSSS